ncbi:MAG: hypothetical protein K6T81_11655 [Alicyclobacillus macrosporangiidus]|uniref:hypothetical protein n=1 Tax=Alicyclobacillus macrosporangiidus TaxID=392015 RepID=UPI0026E9E48A|nr:hypothetical protein [Alicyclobacillus macrosporangiidus]MCL6599381.1 hypothetical protein [Alicyclobacillus macrosporangiidus]
MDERITRSGQHTKVNARAVNGQPHPTPQLRQRDAEVTSLADVDSPDDFAYEGQLGSTAPQTAGRAAEPASGRTAAPTAGQATARQAQATRGSQAWTTVDNPDDFE